MINQLSRRALWLALTGALGLAAGACEANGDSIATGQQPQQAQATAAPAASPDILEQHISWLADDARQGREAGTPGYDAAADYVAEEMAALGLMPGGDEGSWFQGVPLRGVTRVMDPATMEMSLTGTGESLTLSPMEDYLIGRSAQDEQFAQTAEAVFVGWGLQAPEFGIDSYDGVDVAGKIVVVLSGMPGGLPSEEAAHYGASKDTLASDLGAVGYVSVPTEASEARYSFDSLVARAGSTSVTWVGPDGAAHDAAPGLVAAASLSQAGAEKLFSAAGRSYGDIRTAAAGDGTIESFAFPGTMTLRGASEHENLASNNVVGMIEGSDPELADEYVVLTAHLDHIGVRNSIDPDADNINNGALDNATGVAIMLEEARLFREAMEAGNPPRRSMIFLAVTAEEKGLIGSEYYAYNPTVPIEDIVANVNLDMPLIIYPFTDVIAFGADHSSLGPTVARAAESLDVELIPDPIPEMSIFTRSDHYRFVQQGVPSVFLFTGFGNGGEEAFRDFMATNYHQPGDDMSQPFDFEAGAKFATLNYRIAREIADAEERPVWNAGNYFGSLYGPDRMAAE